MMQNRFWRITKAQHSVKSEPCGFAAGQVVPPGNDLTVHDSTRNTSGGRHGDRQIMFRVFFAQIARSSQ